MSRRVRGHKINSINSSDYIRFEIDGTWSWLGHQSRHLKSEGKKTRYFLVTALEFTITFIISPTIINLLFTATILSVTFTCFISISIMSSLLDSETLKNLHHSGKLTDFRLFIIIITVCLFRLLETWSIPVGKRERLGLLLY